MASTNTSAEHQQCIDLCGSSSDEDIPPQLAARLAGRLDPQQQRLVREVISLVDDDDDNAAAPAAGRKRKQRKQRARPSKRGVDEDEELSLSDAQENIPAQRARKPRPAPPPPSLIALPIPTVEAAGPSSSSSSAAAAAPAARAAPTPQAIAAYQRARAASVKSRTFPLSQIAPSSTIPTGRTIKPIPGWTGLWPPIRELMQNTIDHLELRKDGGLHPALTLEATPGAVAGSMRLAFCCAGRPVAIIDAAGDTLTIAQAHTYALHPRALDTGVDDLTKGRGADTAGGFGDGFKTAIVALLAMGGACREVRWDFRSAGRDLTWTFGAASRAAVGTFALSTVLEVRMTNGPAQQWATSETAAQQPGDASESDEEGAGPADLTLERSGLSDTDHIFLQVYRVKGIGEAFLREAAPRLTVFWSLDPSRVLSTRRGDVLAEAAAQPPLFAHLLADADAAPSSSAIASFASFASGVLGRLLPGAASARTAVRPMAGVYVRGIWVRKPPIEGALMSYLGRLDVSGRDRNDVDADELLDATLHVLRHATQRDALRAALEPLRKPSLPASWFTRSPRFLNQLLDGNNEFFVHRDHDSPSIAATFTHRRRRALII